MIRINLLPFRAARKKENIRRQISIAVLMIVLTVIFITYLQVTVKSKIDDTQSQVTDMKKKIDSLQVSQEQVEAFKKKTKELQAKLDVINLLEKNRKGPMNMLLTLSNIIPDRAWLTKFNQSGSSITMEGIALDNETISQFLSVLEKDKTFTSIDLNGTAIVSQKGKSFQKFSLKCRESSSK